MRRVLSVQLLTATMLSALPGSALAQSIDYGSLRSLFGEPVTTSATGAPQRSTDVPVTMEIISAEQIKRMPAVDLAGVLGNVIGVDVNQSTLASPDIGIHGYNQPYSPRLLVLVNGRQVYLDHFSMTAWNTLPVVLDEIQQIEVIKGPNTALFGFNAVSGVVNIVTVNPLFDDRSTAAVTVGTQEHRQGTAAVSKKLSDKVGLRLSADALNAREFASGQRAYENGFVQDIERRTLAGEVLAQVTPDIQAGLELTHAETEQTDFLPFPGVGLADFQTSSVRATTAANTGIGLVKAQIYHNWLNSSVTSPGTGYVPLDNAVTVAQIEDLFKIGADHTFRLSGEYRHNELDTTPTTGAQVGYDVYSASGMWDWALTPKLNVTSALRLDHLALYRDGPMPAFSPFTKADYDRDDTSYGYNLGAVYRLTDLDTLRASSSRGIQVPSLIELGYQQPGGLDTLGNPHLLPTVVTNQELGYDRRLPDLEMLARLSVFHQETENIKSLPGNQADNGNDRWYQNVGSSRSNGLEGSLRNQGSGPWRWRVAYAFIHVNDSLRVNRNGLTHSTDFERSTPQHQLKANIGYGWDQWTFDTYGVLTSGSDHLRMTNPTTGALEWQRVSPYLTLSARLNYMPTDWTTLSLIGQDISQVSHKENAGLENERRVLFRASAGF